MNRAGQSEDDSLDTSVGQMLRCSRTAKKISVGQVASHLHLQEAQINFIEADDFDRLPGVTFVRGYLRAYAKCLGLSEQAVLERYSRQVDQGRESALAARCGGKPRSAAGHAFRFAGYAIAVIFLAVPFFWWQAEEEPGVGSGVAVADVIRVDTADGQTIVESLEPSIESTVESVVESLAAKDISLDKN